ncbi:MAG TPA: hypothetical protein VKU00_00905 [Chthonomonadaceae bacterium]|nr:hypothetical protein [Chthonomonadaceae bacterium]
MRHQTGRSEEELSSLWGVSRNTIRAAITEYSGLSPSSGLVDITLGPDNNLWVTCSGNHMVARITPAGDIKTFPTPDVQPFSITSGKDGNLWFTDVGNARIVRMTPKGEISYFVPPAPKSHPGAIASGMDGNIWFCEPEKKKIGRINLKKLEAQQ